MTRFHDMQAVIEDATFIADTGAGLTEAAHRLGFPSPLALERWLNRTGHHDLTNRLRRLDWTPTSVIHGRHHANQPRSA